MKTVDVALGALVRDGRVWLQQRREPGGPLDGLWEFPGGKLQDGEDAAAAVLREFAEETGVRCACGPQIADVRHDYPDRSVRLRLFVLRGETPASANGVARFFARHELDDLPVPTANRALIAALAPRLDGEGGGDREAAAAAAVVQAAAAIAEAGPLRAAIVAGSGMGGLWRERVPAAALDFAELPGFPAAAIPGQSPRLEIHAEDGGATILFRGRLHGYQGFTPWACARTVRLAAALGIHRVLALCAAGSANPDYRAGEVMVVADHLNLSGDNIGNHLPGGPHFHPQNDLYDAGARAALHAVLVPAGLRVHEGVLASLRGPLYETPAEIRMLQRLGADAVSMSIVHEAAAAKMLGVKFAALALVTNRGAGLDPVPPNHEEVSAVAGALSARLSEPLGEFLTRWN